MKTEYFDSAEVSDVGRKRKNNEDACLCIPERGLYCVADGMGGQAGGDLASEAITTTLQQAFSKATMEETSTLLGRIKLFRRAVNQASKWIKNFADEKVIGQMGSTVVALIIDPRNPARAVGLHAGDSRLYQLRNGVLRQVTKDHSAVQALAEKLGIDPSEVPAKYQNELLRAVGLTEAVELEKTPVEIASGDVFLICSDGLTKMMTDEEAAKVIKDGAQEPVEQVVRKLIDNANQAGGKDNVTVVLVRVGDISKAPKVIDAEADDEEQTATLEDAATVAAPPPVNVAPPLHLPDTSDVHGDTPHTPHTPPSGDIVAERNTPEKPTPPPAPVPAAEEARTLAPTLAPTPKPAMIVVPPAKVETKPEPSPAVPPPPPAKSNLSLVILAVVAVAAIVGVGIWVGMGAKNKSAAAPAETNKPAAVAAAPSNPPPVKASAASNAVSAAPVQQAYADAMKNAQAALAKGDYKTAIAQAATALEKSPGDSAATQLQATAQARLKVQEAYVEAMKSAQSALEKRDFAGALGFANEALKNIPNEPNATKLRDAAQQQQQAQQAQQAAAAAAAETEQQYQKALAEGQAALKASDPSAANKAADAALALRPNDAAAQLIKKLCTQMWDMESALRSFGAGDYDYTASICQQHPDVKDFTALAEKCRVEKAALTAAQVAFSNGDYSFAAALPNQPFARKAPFVALLKSAAAEQKLLADAEALKTAKNWKALPALLAQPAYAAVTNKPPFRALAQWAQGEADQEARKAAFQQNLVAYEKLLVWFNVKKPKDAYITTPEARKETLLSTMLTDQLRQQYLTMVSNLETNFAKAGILNQNDRAKNLKDLREIIVHHD